jgi:hypothetical protein
MYVRNMRPAQYEMFASRLHRGMMLVALMPPDGDSSLVIFYAGSRQPLRFVPRGP